MTARIKAMLAERETVEAAKNKVRPPAPELAPVPALLDKATTFFDEGWDGTGWRPSEVLKVGFFIFAGANDPRYAIEWVENSLAEARRRYKDGYLANPFPKEPLPRSAGARA